MRSRKATVSAPRTPPPSSASIRLGPGPKRWWSREVSMPAAVASFMRTMPFVADVS